MGLFDMVMIKDNHISIAGGVKNALRSVDLYLEEIISIWGVRLFSRFSKFFLDLQFSIINMALFF